MRTLDFKCWLIGLMFATATPVAYSAEMHQPMVVINVDRAQNRTAFMSKAHDIYYLQGTDWQDGDVAEVTTLSGVIIDADYEGILWRYDNNGTFTQVAYPWWYTGAKSTTVHTEVVK